MEKYGIDVSFHKGFPNWRQARDSVSFAILGVTELNGKDASFEHNYKGCTENGILIGAYKYSYAKSGSQSRAEADDIVSILAGRPLQMPIYLDLEWDVQTGFSENLRTEIIEQFMEGIEAGGYIFGGIYCNEYWYNNFIPKYAKDKYNFWIAKLPYNDRGYPVESLKPDVKNLVGWQYSWKGKVNGFGTQDVDMDIWYAEIGSDEMTRPAEDEVYPVLMFGSEGGYVRLLQTKLNAFGGIQLDVDGIFGDNTYRAVEVFQSRQDLEVDGIVGPLTWERLMKVTNEKTIHEIAEEVIAGEWGNGAERKRKLEEAGFSYEEIQNEVNSLLE